MKTVQLQLQDALKFYPSFTQEDIAMLTNLPIAAVRRAIKSNNLELATELTEAWKREIMLEDLNMDQIAKKHLTTANLVHRALFCTLKEPKNRTVSHQEIINYMVANKGKHTQAELAEKFGVAQSLICKLNPFRQSYGPIKRLTPGEWVPILDYAKNHSIHAASLRFKVSRAAIYRHLEKEQAC
jgi:hypothetical protein